MRVVRRAIRHSMPHSQSRPRQPSPDVAKLCAILEGKPEEVAPSVRDRPQDLDEMVGQEALIAQLKMVCAGSKLRGTPMPHVLISGPAGYGKTTIAGVIALSLGAELLSTTGPMLRKPHDLAGLLVKTQGPTCLFIDEIHAMSRQAQETLYTVLEDARIDVVGGSGMDTVAYTCALPHVVVIGATTRPGLLAVPFRDRFGVQVTMEPYSDGELAQIVAKALERVGVAHSANEPLEVAQRAKGNPRRALHLTERVLDFAAVNGSESLSEGTVSDALAHFGIDEAGLDEVDFRILAALTGEYAGKTVGLDALAQALDLDPRTLAEQYEPFLVRSGLVVRAKAGRMASAEAYALVAELSEEQ